MGSEDKARVDRQSPKDSSNREIRADQDRERRDWLRRNSQGQSSQKQQG